MNEELTNEVLEAIVNCNGDGDCRLGPAKNFCDNKMLAAALLEERANPKVWDGAPDDAIQAQITWFTKNGGFTGIKTYNRELPKTRAREIAENIVHGINGKTHGETKDIEYVEGVLKRYAEEIKGEA